MRKHKRQNPELTTYELVNAFTGEVVYESEWEIDILKMAKGYREDGIDVYSRKKSDQLSQDAVICIFRCLIYIKII